LLALKALKDMSNSKLIEKTVSSTLAYDGSFLRVHRDQIELADGTKSYREYIKHPGAACIVPILDNGNFLMVHQYRYPIQQVCLEFPAGKLDAGENSLVTAARELEEEVGMKSASIHFLTRIHPVIGYSNEFIDIYLARQLSAGRSNLDSDERLEVIEVSPAELEKKLWDGELTDVKTQIAAHWALKSLISK
jgi:ADP-ribose pyrophosphatase